MITVYTCATNGRDSLRHDQCVAGVEFRAYVDEFHSESTMWQQHHISDLFNSPRRNARMHKILSHQFVETTYSVWMDANVALLVPAERLIQDYLQDSDIAVFQHRDRDCTYDEAARCRDLGLDSTELIDAQVNHYRQAGFEARQGLPETTVVVRRHTDKVREFNNAWWAELCRYSVRDQIGFMFAAKQVGIPVTFITPTKYRHPYFSITNRPAGFEVKS